MCLTFDLYLSRGTCCGEEGKHASLAPRPRVSNNVSHPTKRVKVPSQIVISLTCCIPPCSRSFFVAKTCSKTGIALYSSSRLVANHQQLGGTLSPTTRNCSLQEISYDMKHCIIQTDVPPKPLLITSALLRKNSDIRCAKEPADHAWVSESPFKANVSDLVKDVNQQRMDLRIT